MLKIGNKEIMILMSIHFLQKVEKQTECKNKDIVECCKEYETFNIWNTYTDDNDYLVKHDKLDYKTEMGYYNKEIMLILNRLMKKELIARVKHGYYAMTEKGYKEFEKRVLNNSEYSEMLVMAI